MALILLILLGGLLGWLASIMARSETPTGILTDMGIGIVGALVGGVFFNHGSILGGLSAFALLIAVAGSVALLALYNFVIRHNLHK